MFCLSISKPYLANRFKNCYCFYLIMMISIGGGGGRVDEGDERVKINQTALFVLFCLVPEYQLN